ncbi:hypothetical protein ABIE44_002884 [Marmoricola sp. OAE513]|uniref:Ig-like domain repeat protein n=1 Tax=Marmoricola sp. OAE513 TaxID=2817894 RepID=UPI001AE1ED35
MNTIGSRTRRRLAAAVASAVALGGLVALAPGATAAQTGPVVDSGVATWGISDVLGTARTGFPAPTASAYGTPATYDASTKLSTFGNGNASGAVAADGSATLSFKGATVNWAAGTGNGWIRIADPTVVVDATGTGSVTADVSFGTTPDAATLPPAGVVRGPSRIVIETLSPNSEDGDATYPTTLSNLTYGFAATSTKYTWSNLIGRWSPELLAFLATNDGTNGSGWTFKSTIVNGVATSGSTNGISRYPSAFNLTLDRTVAATTATASLDADGIKIAVNGTGFLKTAPGLYASLRERVAGDSAYTGTGGGVTSDSPTAWISNSAADIGPDPATGANAAIGDNGAFSATIAITKAQIATLDAAKSYTIVTRKAHGQGGSPAHADQVTETPVDLAAVISAAKARKDTTVTATAPAVAYPSAASATVTVTAASGTPNGVVTIKDGANVVDTAPLLDTGSVTLTVPNQTPGTKQYAVEYAGDAGFWKSTGTLSVTVTKAPSTITVTGPASVAYRTAATYTANVSGGATGNVVITGAGVSYTRPISAGKATFVLPATLPAGARTLSFAYAGSSTTAAATTVTKSVTIGKGATAITASVERKATTKKAGKVKVVVASAKGGPVPTGKVTLTLTKGGVTKKLSAKTLSNGKVVATLPKVGKGTWVLKVTYAGSSQHVKSTATKSIKVKKK